MQTRGSNKDRMGFFTIKPTRCTNFPNLLRHETLHVSGSSLPIIRSLFTVHSALVYVIQVWRQLSSSVQWINSWWWAEELPETCRVSCRSKFGKLVHLVGFIIKKFVTMHGHVNVKDKMCSWKSNHCTSKTEGLPVNCNCLFLFFYFVQWPTKAQLIEKLSQR